jgi:transposase
MYVKRYVVQRGRKRYVYLRLVEAYRDEHGKVRHRVLHTLGREDQLKQSGQLEQLAATLTRLDPPMTGTRREVGSLLLVHHYLDRLGLVDIVDRHLPQRGHAQLTTGEVIAALIANRLAAPSPLYDVAGWATSAAMAEVLGIPGALLNDDRLGRALEALAPLAEELRGAVMLAAIDRFGVDAGRLHLDLTTLRVAGAYEDSALVRKGWGPDRRVARQVRVLQATSPQGLPLYVRPHPGDAAELACIGMALERLAQLLPPGLLVCADSALGHVKNLCAAHRAGLRFVVPLRDASGFAERFLAEVGHHGLHRLDYRSRRQQHLPAARQTRYRGALRPFQVTDPDTGASHPFRVAYIWSSEEAHSVDDGRQRALVKAEQALGKVQRGLGGRYYQTRKQVDTKVAQLLGPAVRDLLKVTTGTRAGVPTLRFERDQHAIDQAARTDGVYALCTNLPGRLSATQVLRLYKDQPLVELRHRDAKQTLRVRPIFLHNDDRITALVSVVGLALVIFGLIETDLRGAVGSNAALQGLLPEGRAARPTARNILAAFQGLGLTHTHHGIVLDRLTRTQRRILQLLTIPIPWPEQAK